MTDLGDYRDVSQLKQMLRGPMYQAICNIRGVPELLPDPL